jgi:pimeloyl-ACP methyl ester carboxylesterase
MSMTSTASTTRGQTTTATFGDVAYLENGQGPAAVFIHGVFLNADLWHHQLSGLADCRRCLAVDLLAHGDSPYSGGGELTMTDQADMVVEFLDSMGLDTVDLVGNDTGGAIAQLVVARIPGRIRTLTLTNCDTDENCPPAAFAPIHELAHRGELAGALMALASDPETARSSLASGLERPDDLSDELIAGFLGPITSSAARSMAIQGYVAGMDSGPLVAIRGDLAKFDSPTLIVWGTGDEFFDIAWAHWLAATIPGTVTCIELEGAKLFFPLERPAELNQALRDLWTGADG